MSTLTKILIVLLAFSSFFLCGIVVTYVANADNYRQKLNDISNDRDGLSKKVKELTKQINDKADQKTLAEEQMSSEVASLKSKISESDTNLKNSEREKAALLSKIDNWATITKDFYQTNDKQGQLLKNTLEELNKIQTEQVNDRKAKNDAEAALAEKTATVESLEAEKQRLIDEKTELQTKLGLIPKPAGKGKTSVAGAMQKEAAKPTAQAVGSENVMQGRITAVDLKNSMASLSVGKADGVKEGMKFHITRGDDFICDVQIIDVEAQESVGLLELVQKQPQVGDIASTNL